MTAGLWDTRITTSVLMENTMKASEWRTTTSWYFAYGLFKSPRNPDLFAAPSCSARTGKREVSAQPHTPRPGSSVLFCKNRDSSYTCTYRGIKEGAYLAPGLHHMLLYQYKTAGEKPWSISKLLRTLAAVGRSFSIILILLVIPVCYTEEKQGYKGFCFNSNSSVGSFYRSPFHI